MSVDLLVFGPHPDDLEIGLGGTIARHAALWPDALASATSRLGEMGSNGTVDDRLAEAEAARVALGAAWRENLRVGPTVALAKTPPISNRRSPSSDVIAPERSPCPTGPIGIPITSPPAKC